MAKAPITRDTLLAGELDVTLYADTQSVYAKIYGTEVTAANLRNLADELDRLQAARDVFFDIKEYSVNYKPDSGQYCEDSIIIKAVDAVEALSVFSDMKLGEAKCAVDCKTGETHVA